ncbi:MAG: hypothetical protein R3D71_10000 [Rickettsiales bacterium]
MSNTEKIRELNDKIRVTGTGDDTLTGGAGSDFIDGGDGKDTASYEGDTTAINYDVKAGTIKQGSDTDILKNIERVIGTSAKNDTADFKGFTVPSTKFDFSIDIDSSGKYYSSINLKSEKLSISLADIERLEFSDGVQQMEIKPLSNTFTDIEEIHMGGGNDVVVMSGAPQPYLEIYLEDGNDVLVSAPRGSIVYGGSGADTFELSSDYLIADADTTDTITYGGRTIHGGVTFNTQESPWAKGIYGEIIPAPTRGSGAANDNPANDNHLDISVNAAIAS